MKRFLITLLVLMVITGCKKELKPYANSVVDDLTVATLTGYRNVPARSDYVKQGDFVVADKLHQNGGSFILYLGFPKCPYCFDFFPVLFEVVEKYEVPIVYLNILEIQNNLGGYENTINDKFFNKFMETYDNYLEYNEDGEKDIEFPFILFVKEGKVIFTHIGTVSNHDAHQEPLTEAQREKLYKIIDKAFIKFLT